MDIYELMMEISISTVASGLPATAPYVPIVHSMGTFTVTSIPQVVRDVGTTTALTGRNAAVGFVLLLAFLPAVGCAMKKMAPPPPPPPDVSIFGNDSDRLQESLFKGDQAVLSNQDIDRILTARITLKDRHRLAVLRLNTRSTWYQEIADLEAQNSERLLKALGSTTQLTQVRFMPTLLIPERRTVPYLREAAARFQADLLLIYGTRVQTFRRDRLIGPDEVHAEAVVESVLLDVRTGIVIHTAQTTESISAKKAPSDVNFSETVVKAETEATGKALLKLADAVVTFVSAGGK